MGELKGSIGENTVHLCIDMQRLFGPGSPWAAPWTQRVESTIAKLVERTPAYTVFTRFIPARSAEEARGAWRRFYEKWEEITLRRLNPDLIRIVPALEYYIPPALCFDRTTYSVFADGRLHTSLNDRNVDTLLISGAETDVCVLASVLNAVDLGYRVIAIRNALASSSGETHEALIKLYERRFSIQIELADMVDVLDAWKV